jgi:streptogramin lyase
MRSKRSILAVSGLLMAAAGTAQAGSFVFTDTADWDAGTYASTNAGPPGFDQVQLNPNIVTTFNHIWVALSGRGTAVRINTSHVDADGRVTLADSAAGNGAVFGEYYTAPDGRGRDPSRTTVDVNGDVWVGNRGEWGWDGLGGSVTKLSANPTGTTSTGTWNGSNFDVLPWNNAGGADNAGGTATASDSAIAHYVRTPGTANRTIAVDANNDVWVGGYDNKVHTRIDGDTGAVVGPTVTMNPGGYGGLIDSNGILWSSGWSSNQISRYDTGTVSGTPGPLPTVTNATSGYQPSYGLGVDSQGNIWNSHYDAGRITKFSSDGTTLGTFTLTGSGSRGVAVTPDDNIWVANSFSNNVTRLDNNGNVLATINVEGYPTGVSVDSNGKVWVANLNGNSAQRINPATNAVELTVELGSGASPYNYSDMTGSVIGGITNPTGTWTTVIDAGALGTDWDKVFWNTEAEGSIPAGTGIVIQVRAADTLAGLAAEAWQAYLSGASLGLDGRYAEVRAILTRTGTGAGAVSPILSDLRLTTVQTGVVPLPASWLLLGSGIAGLMHLSRRRRATA